MMSEEQLVDGLVELIIKGGEKARDLVKGILTRHGAFSDEEAEVTVKALYEMRSRLTNDKG